jgi:hypothetical protein
MADTKSPETPLHTKIVPARGAAQKAAATLKEQSTKRPRVPSARKSLGDASDAADSAVEDEMSFDGPSKRRGSGVRGSRMRGRGRGRGGAARGDPERAPVGHTPSKSSLKSGAVSSTPSSRSTSPLSSDPVATPQKRLLPSLFDTPSKRTKVAVSHRKPRPSSSFSTVLLNSSPSSGSSSKYDDLYARGDLVWVRLDSRGVLAGSQAKGEEESYWWPAQVCFSFIHPTLLMRMATSKGYW